MSFYDMAFRKNPSTPPMTDAERAARVDELVRLTHWISTKDDWVSILAHVGLRAAQLKQHKENLPQLTFTEESADG